MIDSILIRGARDNNLKDVSSAIPKNRIVVFTGPSWPAAQHPVGR